MEDILKEIKLESILLSFLEQRMQPENVMSLSDEQVVRLGVSCTIGDGIRMRELCKKTVENTVPEAETTNRPSVSGRQS